MRFIQPILQRFFQELLKKSLSSFYKKLRHNLSLGITQDVSSNAFKNYCCNFYRDFFKFIFIYSGILSLIDLEVPLENFQEILLGILSRDSSKVLPGSFSDCLGFIQSFLQRFFSKNSLSNSCRNCSRIYVLALLRYFL